jgi:photosystem II stability/assembly factor-like uncharacterized protein
VPPLRLSPIALFLLFLLLPGWACRREAPPVPDQVISRENRKMAPADAFFIQRAYPDSAFAWRQYLRALRQAEADRALKSGFKGFGENWIARGPANVGARINTVAVNPRDEREIYAGYSTGGLFKTDDGGQRWRPIFDERSYLAIGHVTIDPSDPQTIYVGTGDPNISGYPAIGDGVYRSRDGGRTWRHLGLERQGIIARIVIHPSRPEILYAAAMGLPFQRDANRGVYRSRDGGLSWEQVLFISEQTGVIDLVMHPTNPDILYAAGWDRIRNNRESVIFGAGARVFRTADGGDTFTALEGGLPRGQMGRIGLAVTPAAPDAIYALYVDTEQQLHGIYRSNDAGLRWSALFSRHSPRGINLNIYGGFGWYFAKFRVHPTDANDITVLGIESWRTRNGGLFWQRASPPWWDDTVHIDHHDLQFTASGAWLLATDGGLYRSDDNTASWRKIENIPATQFYRIAYNPHRPYWYYGGAQDNGSIGGPNLETDWEQYYGADGFRMIFHPIEPATFYIETQNGKIWTTNDGGRHWRDASLGIVRGDPRNWDMPYLMSAHSPDVLYAGTHRVYRSEGNYPPFWAPISADLTGRGAGDIAQFFNISTLAESPLERRLLYAGTSNGRLWRSENQGGQWTEITRGLPNRYITDVKASTTLVDRVFVAHSGYRDNDFLPRLHRSDDRGATWSDISGDLPDLAINDLLVLPEHQDSVIFVATDGGVYGSLDGGGRWARLGGNMPAVPVYELLYNPTTRELVAGTFGRSVLAFPLDALDIDKKFSTASRRAAPAQMALRLFPNPVSDFLRVDIEDLNAPANAQVRLFDAKGAACGEWRGMLAAGAPLELDLRRLPPGVYFLVARVGESSYWRRFLKGE